MDKVYSVFISSTYEDLKEYRQAAIQTVLSHGFLPLVMENFNSSPYEPQELIKKYLSKTDFLILLVENCYGSIWEQEQISFTEFEYTEAVKNNIPIIVFFADNILGLPNDAEISILLGKTPTGARLKQKKLKEFREKLKSTRSVFKSADDLKALISSSLSRVPEDFLRPGWVRGDLVSKTAEYAIKINFIKSKIIQEEFEKIEKSLYELNRFLYPFSKAMPTRPILTRKDDFLFSIVFVVKADNLYIAQTRKEQFEELAKRSVSFHSCEYELFKGFSGFNN